MCTPTSCWPPTILIARDGFKNVCVGGLYSTFQSMVWCVCLLRISLVLEYLFQPKMPRWAESGVVCGAYLLLCFIGFMSSLFLRA